MDRQDRRAQQHRDRRDLDEWEQHRRRRALKGAQQEEVVAEGARATEERKPALEGLAEGTIHHNAWRWHVSSYRPLRGRCREVAARQHDEIFPTERQMTPRTHRG
eukprot:3188269-Prymnesium_polylepis.2